MIKTQAALSQRINIGCFKIVRPVATDVSSPEIIREDENDVGLGGRFRGL